MTPMTGTLAAVAFLVALQAAPAMASVVTEEVDIAPTQTVVSTGYCLLTRGNRQYVAFYDDSRQMTVGVRALGGRRWQFKRLPETLGWDSHNYITMAFDAAGCLHVSGNMHGHPLKYFRADKPGDISSLVRVEHMTGERESRCTYPRFLYDPAGNLLFTYRDGGSGNGDQLYNIYDDKERSWKRLLDTPLTDGEGLTNAYFAGPSRGPDGYFHLVWVWRDTGDAATNHDLTYARSRDLRHWETSSGKPLALPIKISSAEIVDPVPAGGGMINGNTAIGFDSKKRPIISYHKFDENGKTQLYQARLENGKWKIYCSTDWSYRWEFGGGGTIPFEISIRGISPAGKGKLKQSVSHKVEGSGILTLDEKTLRVTGKLPDLEPLPKQLTQVTSSFPEIQDRILGDSGSSGEPGVGYYLRWESLPAYRDRPRQPPLPEPVMLKVFKVSQQP